MSSATRISRPLAADCTLVPSRRARLLTLLLLVAAVPALLFNGLPLAVRILLFALLPVVLLYLRQRQEAHEIQALALRGDQLLLQFADGRKLQTKLCRRRFVSPLFVGLGWRPPGSCRRRSLGLFPDQMSPEDWRRLCAVLRSSAHS